MSASTFDHAMRPASPRPLHGLGQALSVALAWERRARSRAALRDLPPHLLRDVGLLESDALREADKPFWRD